MKTAVEMLCIALKGGAVVKTPVEKWEIEYTNEVVSISWTPADAPADRLVFVAPADISAVWTERA